MNARAVLHLPLDVCELAFLAFGMVLIGLTNRYNAPRLHCGFYRRSQEVDLYKGRGPRSVARSTCIKVSLDDEA